MNNQQTIKGLEDLPVFQSNPFYIPIRKGESVRNLESLPVHEIARIKCSPKEFEEPYTGDKYRGRRIMFVAVVGRDPDATKIYYYTCFTEKEKDGYIVCSYLDSSSYMLVKGISSYEIIPKNLGSKEQPLERRI